MMVELFTRLFTAILDMGSAIGSFFTQSLNEATGLGLDLILGDIATVPLYEVMIGAGLIGVMIYTLVKWVIR